MLWVPGCYLVPSTADIGSGAGQMSPNLKTKGGRGDAFDSILVHYSMGPIPREVMPLLQKEMVSVMARGSRYTRISPGGVRENKIEDFLGKIVYSSLFRKRLNFLLVCESLWRRCVEIFVIFSA